MRRFLPAVVVAALVLLSLGLAFVKLRYGAGAPYPSPYVPQDGRAMTPMVQLDFPLGNVTTSSTGRVFFNIHPFAKAQRFTDTFLFELVDGAPRPYPDAASQADLHTVFGMTVDGEGRLWLTCPASLDREQTRLIAYDLKTGQRVVEHAFPPGVARFAQDMRVTRDGRNMIMADTGLFRFTPAALLVVDLETFTVRRLLEGHPAVSPQDWFIETFEGHPLRLAYGLVTFAVGVDGIALTDEHVVFATMTHDTAYRVALDAVLNPALSDAELDEKLEVLGPKPLSDGIEIGPNGSVLITDIEHGALARLKDGTLAPLGYAEAVIWSDGVSVHGTTAYVTDSGIPAYIDPLARPPSRAALEAHAPYGLYTVSLELED